MTPLESPKIVSTSNEPRAQIYPKSNQNQAIIFPESTQDVWGAYGNPPQRIPPVDPPEGPPGGSPVDPPSICFIESIHGFYLLALTPVREVLAVLEAALGPFGRPLGAPISPPASS